MSDFVVYYNWNKLNVNFQIFYFEPPQGRFPFLISPEKLNHRVQLTKSLESDTGFWIYVQRLRARTLNLQYTKFLLFSKKKGDVLTRHASAVKAFVTKSLKNALLNTIYDTDY